MMMKWVAIAIIGFFACMAIGIYMGEKQDTEKLKVCVDSGTKFEDCQKSIRGY